MSSSPILSMPYILPGQAQKHVTHNQALEMLDALVQLRLSDTEVTAPPSEPFEGQVVAVAATTTGPFAGKEGQLACFYGGGWIFLEPREGFLAWSEKEQAVQVFRGGMWQSLSATGSAGSFEGIGINATWDETSRLSVAAATTTLSHEGASHRLVVNKASADETASLLFQDAFSGRAEIGLAGSDDLSVKVSGDDGSWITAFTVESATGKTSFGTITAERIEGAAVQTSSEDTTPGRLMRADLGYCPGNLVGIVSQNEGMPTGAAMERGINQRGEYTRYADGSQICRISNFTLVQNAAFHLRQVWNFPAPFADQPTVFHTPDLASATGYAAAFSERTYWGAATSKAFATNAIIDQFKAHAAPDIPPGATLVTSCFAVGRWF